MKAETFKKKLIKLLEEPDKQGILRGDYVCHESIPEETSFDAHFTACGEDDEETFLVLIQKV